MSNLSSSVKRTMPVTRKRSLRLPVDRRCALSRLRPRDSRRAPCCSGRGIFWSGSAPIRQRTQLINALRGHLSEHGVVAAQGPANVKVLEEAIEDQTTSLPILVVELARIFLDQIEGLSKTISKLEKVTAYEAIGGETTRRLQTMPGVGPIAALAIETFAPPMDVFKRGRDFAAWLGLVPRQQSTGGKQVLGKISKMGQRDIRRLLIIGAMTLVRAALRKGAPEGNWLQRMLARKPKMLVAIALANKMARSAWAMLAKGEDFQVPAVAAI